MVQDWIALGRLWMAGREMILTMLHLTISMTFCIALFVEDPLTSPVYHPRPLAPDVEYITFSAYGRDSILRHLPRGER